MDDSPGAPVPHQDSAMRHILGGGEGFDDHGGDKGIALSEQDVALFKARAIHESKVLLYAADLQRESSATKGRAC